MIITSVRFKRSKNMPLEAGVHIESQYDTVLVDLFGRVVQQVWYFVNDEELDIVWEPKPFSERTTSTPPPEREMP